MFIFDLLFMVGQLAVAGAGGLYLYRDYKNGFPKLQALAGSVKRALGAATPQDDVTRANAVVEHYSKNLGLLREAVSAIETNYQMAERQEKEQLVLAAEFRNLTDEAMREGDESTAVVAANARLQHEKRAEMFGLQKEQQRNIAAGMRSEFETLEMEFDIVRTQADTVVVRAAIIDANRRLYQLISQVDAQTGLTAKGELDQVMIDTERKMIQTGILVEMVKDRGSARAKKLLATVGLRNALEEARARIALPAASTNGRPDDYTIDSEEGISEKAAG